MRGQKAEYEMCIVEKVGTSTASLVIDDLLGPMSMVVWHEQQPKLVKRLRAAQQDKRRVTATVRVDEVAQVVLLLAVQYAEPRPPRPVMFRKATAEEITAYAAGKDANGRKPLYPLVYWVRVGNVACVVEGLYEGKDGVDYEVMAPAGFHFGGDGDGCHSLLCHSVADVKGRAVSSTLEKCHERC